MLLTDEIKVVTACSPAALTGAAGDGDYINLKNVSRAQVVVSVKNSTSVTAGNVSLYQASNVAGAGEKVLTFTNYLKNDDISVDDVLTEATTANNSFLTTATNSKNGLYVINIPFANLDTANGFYSVRVDVANMANAVASATYILDTDYSPKTLSVITD